MAFSVLEHAEGRYGIIGPRPERPEFAEQLAAEVPYYRLRHTVKPELTGWVQVMCRYGASVEDAPVKLRHDCYISNIRACIWIC